ncbi:TIGR00303 family protein [Synergistaceae bacterium OttesenSCG-928-I11]|nr:TIGR00303 family protein [Synergistaceae bacterium OttesenSCG-928-I11]
MRWNGSSLRSKNGARRVFFLFIGGTEISKVKGLSAAGANPEIVPYTSPADADLIRFGRPRVTEHFPMDPDGHPTPAIITRAALVAANLPCCVVRAGSYIPPHPPYVELGAAFGRDPSKEPAVPDAENIFEAARTYAAFYCTHLKSATLAESVPGGTTTALLVLRALGHDGMVSSAGPVNPTSLKEEMWRAASARTGIGRGDWASRPMDAVRELGDPMQAAVAGFAAGLPRETEVVLAGGTQMLAVAAILRAVAPWVRPLVATTAYVGRDATSSFRELADTIGVKTYYAPLDFSGSAYKGLRDYEEGFVKEGAGAGGAVFCAERCGVPATEVVRRVEEIYAIWRHQCFRTL